MSRYEVLTFGHIAAGTIWLGAGFVLTLLVLGYGRSGQTDRVAALGKDLGWLAPRLFIPSSLATLIFGLLLVADGFWEIGELWIVLALAGWAASFLIGFLYFRPMGERIAAIAESEGPESPKISEIQGRVNIVDRVQLTVLFLVLADMVFKPTGEDTAELILGALILTAAIAAAAVSIGRGQARSA
jgi:hypothetical protein